ncbi:MAG: hydroxymethylbilane synthase [Planctomycetaceae bacterium]|nr:hydroxymethylbilane synthase [Planctomycetaceae bacterium]
MRANILRIATRGSSLAMAQAKLVADALKSCHSELAIEMVTVTTQGDRDRISPLWKMAGSGFFTTQVEQAVLRDQADIAVHSYKDLPVQFSPGLVIGAIPERKYAEDVLVAGEPIRGLCQLHRDALVGSSSPRRTAQLKRLRPDLVVRPIRGNVETRLAKVRNGDFDAIVLARAGLERLNLTPQISFVFDPCEFIPAPAQGALAVQCRKDDSAVKTLLADIHHEATARAVGAERRILEQLQPGCSAPIGALARTDGEDLLIDAFVADLEGKRYIRETIKGPAASWTELCDVLVQRLLAAGAQAVLESVSRS